MLILGIGEGESITLTDTDASAVIGIIRRIKPLREDTSEILLGFDFPKKICIVRDTLIRGDVKRKGAENDHKEHI